jgi:hypothetical protein
MNVTFEQSSQLAQTIKNNDVSRYMSGMSCSSQAESAFDLYSVVGYAVLLYDTFLTFPEELELVWRSKPNFAKYAFLGNKYVVLGILTMEMISKRLVSASNFECSF